MVEVEGWRCDNQPVLPQQLRKLGQGTRGVGVTSVSDGVADAVVVAT